MEMPKYITEPIEKAKSQYLELIGKELTCISIDSKRHGFLFKYITKGKRYKVIDIIVNTGGNIGILIEDDNVGNPLYDDDRNQSSFPIENFDYIKFLRNSKINNILK